MLDESHLFVFLIDQVPVRIWRGAADDPTDRILKRQQVEAQQLSLALGEAWNWHWSAFAAGSMFLQTVVGAFASYLCWVWLLGRYPATRMGSFALSTPLFALLFGALWLGEAVTAELLGALAVVGLGITLVNRRRT